MLGILENFAYSTNGINVVLNQHLGKLSQNVMTCCSRFYVSFIVLYFTMVFILSCKYYVI
jgi:hypothetical protein